ncbi:T9SS type A sorting domain-containing protein [Hymenobacter coalescens]
MPNFILYNKYTGVLRVFAYLNESQTFSKVIMTMTGVAGSQSGGQVSAAAGLGQPLVKGADQYLAQNQGEDLTTYICGFGGSKGWIMGEFAMLFDPHHTDPKFYESKLEFKIYGIVSSTLELSGDFRFVTKPQEGFGFAGPASQLDASPGSGAKQFIATGSKFLGKFNSIADQVLALNQKANEVVANISPQTPAVPLRGVRAVAGLISGATGGSEKGGGLKTLFGVASQAGGLFSMLGSVAAVLWPDAPGSTAPAPAPPTVSTGSIRLTGSISTSTLLGQAVYVQVPGTPHNFNGSTNANVRMTQPYYDCPMGLFNLRATPQIDRIDYPRAARHNGPRGAVPEQQYSSYSITADLQPVVNQLSGAQVVSMRAAIMQKVSHYTLAEAWPASRYNLMYAQVAAGNLIAEPYDVGPTSSEKDNLYLVHTPFVNVGCFRGMAFNAPTDSLDKYPAFVRVIVELRRAGAPAGAAPIIFVQDYAIRTASSSYQNRSYLDVADYTPYWFGTSTLEPLDKSYTGVVFNPYSQYFSAPSALSFDGSSSLRMDVVRNGGTQGYGGGSGGFAAGLSIGFQGTLDVPEGMNVEMITERERGAYCAAPNLAAQAVGSCNNYNPWATPTRPAPGAPPSGPLSPPETGTVQLTLTPNPATGRTTAQLASPMAKLPIEQAYLLDMQGRQLWQHAATAKTGQQVEIPLRGLPTGLYLVKVVAGQRQYVSKLQVY